MNFSMKIIAILFAIMFGAIGCSNNKTVPVSEDAGTTVVQDTTDAGVDASLECVQEQL